MPTKARDTFDENAKDVERLLEIHADVGGDAKGRRFGLEVLNKSALVLITAIWEAYCEDVVSEALEHLVNNVPQASHLPKELRKRITADIKSEPNDLAMWDLADGGWKSKAKARLTTLTAERNRKLNTPKAEQIDELFAAGIGLSKLSDAWKWKKMSSTKARQKLDDYVGVRGAIAHRGAAAAGIKKWQVTDHFQHVKRLVAQTDSRVAQHVKNSTGKSLW